MAVSTRIGVKLRSALARERRKNRRLRTVINELKERVEQNRRDLDLQFTRIANMQMELDDLKRRSR